MLCVDWNDDDPFEIMGDYNEGDFVSIDISFVPCNYVHTMYGYKGDSVHQQCIGSLDEQIKYLGSSHFIIYSN